MSKPRIDLDRLKRLAMLELSPEEEREVEKRLEKILEYFWQLRKLGLSGVEPMYTVEFEEASYREDEPKSYDPDELLKLVPKKKDRYVKAPRIV